MIALVEFMEQLYQLPTFYIIVGTFVFLIITIGAGWIGHGWLGLMITGMILFFTYTFSQELDQVNGAYYLNMFTEIIGALIVALFFGFHTRDFRTPFVIIFSVVTILTLIPLTNSHGFEQEFWLNLSTELVGSLIIFFLLSELIDGERGLGLSRRGKIRRTVRLYRIQREAELEVEIQEQKQRVDEMLAQKAESTFKRYEKMLSETDTVIHLRGSSHADIERKISSLNVQRIKGRRFNKGKDGVECIVIAILAN